MGLQQVLAPQLQQSLQILQAPTLELKALVEQELQQNPVREEAPVTDAEQVEKPKSEDGDAPEASDPAEPPSDVTFEGG
ncbi:RNA polymerase sigma-54 factor, partial [Lacticaseibacillus rhamnosus]